MKNKIKAYNYISKLSVPLNNSWGWIFVVV